LRLSWSLSLPSGLISPQVSRRGPGRRGDDLRVEDRTEGRPKGVSERLPSEPEARPRVKARSDRINTRSANDGSRRRARFPASGLRRSPACLSSWLQCQYLPHCWFSQSPCSDGASWFKVAVGYIAFFHPPRGRRSATDRLPSFSRLGRSSFGGPVVSLPAGWERMPPQSFQVVRFPQFRLKQGAAEPQLSSRE
jgi:hypothetical protein